MRAMTGVGSGPAAAEGPEYFREFTRTLLKHGFFCGGAWESPDTMHFELAEGPDLATPAKAGATYGPAGAIGR